LENGFSGQQFEILKHEAHPSSQKIQACSPDSVQVDPTNQYLTFRRWLGAKYEPEEGRLSRTAGPCDKYKLPFADSQVNIL
jgi:hypothetical protein